MLACVRSNEYIDVSVAFVIVVVVVVGSMFLSSSLLLLLFFLWSSLLVPCLFLLVWFSTPGWLQQL